MTLDQKAKLEDVIAVVNKNTKAILALHDYVMAIVDRLAEDLPGVPYEDEVVVKLPDFEHRFMQISYHKYPKHNEDPSHIECGKAMHELDPNSH